MFDCDDFIKNDLRSNIWILKLFPNDIEKWVRCRDVERERLLLSEYMGWLVKRYAKLQVWRRSDGILLVRQALKSWDKWRIL